MVSCMLHDPQHCKGCRRQLLVIYVVTAMLSASRQELHAVIFVLGEAAERLLYQ